MKKALAALLSLVMVLSLAACGGSGGKTTLNVIISQYGNYTQDWWPTFEKDFEDTYNNIDLNVEIVSWNDLYTVVSTRISTNQAPDILNIDTFADYLADDLLVPAEEYTSAELKAKLIPSFWTANELDGTVWALPILASCRAMFCNMDLLNEAGITAPPTTWAEVDAACQAIKDKFGDSIVPWGLDISTDEGQAAFSYYSWNFGGGFMDGSGNWALNSAENVQAVEYIKQLIDSGYCNSAPYTDTRYPLQDAFSAGTLAMMIGPMNMVSADSSVNYQSVGIPTNTGTSTGLGVCDQLMVFKNDSVKDQDARTKAISAFFDFFYDCERYSDYMVYEGFLPATSDSSEYLASSAEKHKVGGSDATGNSEYFKTFCAQLPNCQFYPMSKSEWMDVRNGVIEVEQQVCQGNTSAKDALDNLQKSIAG